MERNWGKKGESHPTNRNFDPPKISRVKEFQGEDNDEEKDDFEVEQDEEQPSDYNAGVIEEKAISLAEKLDETFGFHRINEGEKLGWLMNLRPVGNFTSLLQDNVS